MRPRMPLAVGPLLLLTAVATLFAVSVVAAPRSLTVDDVLRLHAAGVHEDVIISEIVVTDTVFDLEVEDILRLQEAGVSDRLLQFMVDTGRADMSGLTDEATGEEAETWDDDEGTETEEYAHEEDDDVSSRLFVSLRWGYPIWWYDVYWWDYWYYDCHYDPWYVSWSYPCAVWYPTWYWPRRCWISPGWGYRYTWWTHSYGGWWGDRYWWRGTWDGWRGWDAPHNLSDRKYKVGSGSSGKTLVAGAGLRVPDGTRLLADRKPSLRGKDGSERYVDAKHPADPRHPTRLTGAKLPGDSGRRDGIRRPAKPTGHSVAPDRGDIRRPVRPIRKPAAASTPVKRVVKRTEGAPRDTGVRSTPPRGSTPPRAPDKPRAQVREKPKVKDSKVRHSAPAPKSQAAPPPRVESRPPSRSAPAPAPRSSSGGKAPPRGGGTSGGSGKSRGR